MKKILIDAIKDGIKNGIILFVVVVLVTNSAWALRHLRCVVHIENVDGEWETTYWVKNRPEFYGERDNLIGYTEVSLIEYKVCRVGQEYRNLVWAIENICLFDPEADL